VGVSLKSDFAIRQARATEVVSSNKASNELG
jgi:hypothetical protein